MQSCRVVLLQFPVVSLSRSFKVIELAPSILSADFARLAEDVQAALEGGATLLHVDVMDGHFVPNITIGPPVVTSLRRATEATLDVHLMIENPDQYIPAFVEAGADWISVHQETCPHLHRTLELIRNSGAKPGVVINPATPVQTLGEVLEIVDFVLVMSVNPGFGGQKFIPATLDKIRKLCTMRTAKAANFRVEVDGGVSLETIGEIVRAGAEILVAGNAVFGSGDPRKNVGQLLRAAKEAMLQKV
jgi:ribulose-phosphate 3-epimerase